MSKIVPIEKSKTIDYGHETHKNFWRKRVVSEVPAFGKQLKLNEKNSVICVMSEDVTCADTIRDLFDAGKSGNRVYILTASQNKIVETLEKNCLIKYGRDIMGSFILNVNAKTGFFLNAPLTESGINSRDAICLTLDAEQADILYRHFCYYFWESEPNPPAGVFPNLNNFCDSEHIQKVIDGKKETVFLPAVQSVINASTIITSLTGNNANAVQRLAENGTVIRALKSGNTIYSIENADGMFIFPKAAISGNDVLWSLKLNDAQKTLVKNHLQKIEANADYEFCLSKTRSELKNAYILPQDSSNSTHIKPNETQAMKDNVLEKLSPKEDFEAAEPRCFTDDGVSIEITYKWKNIPFYLPTTVNTHSLYSDWANEIKKIKIFLDNDILQKIDAAEKAESGMAKAIARRILGKKTAFGSFKDEINELRHFDYANAAKERLNEIISRINDIKRKVTKDIEDLHEEDRKAKIDEDIARKETLIEEKRALLKKLETDKTDAVKKLEQENDAEKSETSKDGHEKADKKNAKDIAVINSRFQSDMNKTNNEINRLLDEIEREKKRKDTAPIPGQKSSDLEIFNKNQKQAGSSQSQFAVPKLPHLPKAGKLFQAGNASYLAIADWDDFEKGKQEADRLSAKLCAERG
ncbi:MAG: hypothetical protein FWB94_07715 [Chitinispirillia bacterium]|nr:hypothetical protein [Chitinispirillia bacterium]